MEPTPAKWNPVPFTPVMSWKKWNPIPTMCWKVEPSSFHPSNVLGKVEPNPFTPAMCWKVEPFIPVPSYMNIPCHSIADARDAAYYQPCRNTVYGMETSMHTCRLSVMHTCPLSLLLSLTSKNCNCFKLCSPHQTLQRYKTIERTSTSTTLT